MARPSLRVGSRVKVVNPKLSDYERYGDVVNIYMADTYPYLVAFSDTYRRAFRAWELMEYPQYGTTPDMECGDTQRRQA